MYSVSGKSIKKIFYHKTKVNVKGTKHEAFKENFTIFSVFGNSTKKLFCVSVDVIETKRKWTPFCGIRMIEVTSCFLLGENLWYFQIYIWFSPGKTFVCAIFHSIDTDEQVNKMHVQIYFWQNNEAEKIYEFLTRKYWAKRSNVQFDD
jgi:hypothetical protein